MPLRFLVELSAALRRLAREPGFTAGVALILAIALGGATAMFSIVNGVLLKPLPYGDAARLVRIGHRHAERGEVFGAFSPQDAEDLAARSRALESVAAYLFWPGQSTVNAIIADAPMQLDSAFVTGRFFDTLGASARLGRALMPSDDAPGQDVVVLSDRAWRTLLGGDAGAVGRDIRIAGRPFRVVGVMPPEFDYPDARVQVFVPRAYLTDDMIPSRRDVRWLEAIGRVRPDFERGAAAAEIDGVVAAIAADHPDTNAAWGHALVQPLFEQVVGAGRAPLAALFAATVLVLVTACVNLANLMLARAHRRERELATRGALGAAPGRIAAHWFADAAVLSGLGVVAGFGFAHLVLRLIESQLQAPIARQAEVGLDGTVLAFGAALAALTALAIAALPAWRARRIDVAQVLSRGGSSTTSPRHARLRGGLVVAQVALVCALGYATGLAIESLGRAMAVDPGVDTAGVLGFSVSLEGPRYEADGAAAIARDRILDAVRAVPGVVAAAGSKNEPIGETGEGYSFAYVDRPDVPILPEHGLLFVTPGYFETLGVPLLRGRDFTGSEKPGEAITIVVNRAFAEQFFPDQDVVGRQVQFADTRIEIVGLVGDVRHAGIRSAADSTVYASLGQFSRSSLVVSVRSTATGAAFIDRLREAVWSVDRELPIVGMRWTHERIAQLEAQPRLVTQVLSAFALLSALIGGLGVFGLLAYVVGERRRELAIRLAIGARPHGLLRSVIGQGARLALLGAAVGVPLGIAAARLMQSGLYDTAVFEPVVLGAIVLGALALATAAAIAPAIGALRTQPMQVLRQD
jgi:predicted permease